MNNNFTRKAQVDEHQIPNLGAPGSRPGARATGDASARATDRLLLSKRCNCDDMLDLQKRVHAAKAPLVDAIVKLAELASSPTSAAGVALTDCRKALSALENEA